MKRVACLIVLAAAAAAAHQAHAQVGANPAAPEIVNTGHGEVRLKPDRASLSVAVVTYGRTAMIAGAHNAQRMTPVLSAVHRQGIPDSSVSTTGYSVEAQYSQPGRPLADSLLCVARNGVEVRLPSLKDLGAIVDTVLAAGATQVSGITFESSQVAEGRQRAIALAIEAARADAAAAAAAAGGRLGPIIEITLDPSSAITPRIMAADGPIMAQRMVTTPISPGDLTVSVQARIRFALIRQP